MVSTDHRCVTVSSDAPIDPIVAPSVTVTEALGLGMVRTAGAGRHGASANAGSRWALLITGLVILLVGQR